MNLVLRIALAVILGVIAVALSATSAHPSRGYNDA